MISRTDISECRARDGQGGDCSLKSALAREVASTFEISITATVGEMTVGTTTMEQARTTTIQRHRRPSVVHAELMTASEDRTTMYEVPGVETLGLVVWRLPQSRVDVRRARWHLDLYVCRRCQFTSCSMRCMMTLLRPTVSPAKCSPHSRASSDRLVETEMTSSIWPRV